MNRGRQVFRALVIVLAILWIYAPAMHGDWLWDDDVYITDNPLFHSLAGLGKVWAAPGPMHEYYPVLSTVEWVQWQLWGMDTLGYHLTNIILHIASSLLVWRLLAKFDLPLAWLGGLLFAIHPLQVESVAWISEMKNTLSLPFFIMAMICWINFQGQYRLRDYTGALLLFLVSMLVKPSMAGFPVIIPLYAWWMRGRVGWRDVQESAPFFAVSLVLGALAVLQTQRESTATVPEVVASMGGPVSWILAAGMVLPFALWKVILPVGLMPIYRGWAGNSWTPAQCFPWPVLAVVVAYCWSQRKSWGRHALLGLGFFVAMLAPVLIFVGMKANTMTWSMDHLFYLPIIGLIGLAVAGLGELERKLSRWRLFGWGLATVMVALLSWQSRAYAGLYASEEKLWTYALERNPEAWLAHNNLGKILSKMGRTSEAIGQFEQALKINPGYAVAHSNWGTALLRIGRVQEAIGQFEQALTIDPDSANAHNNLGNALLQSGRPVEAIGQFEQALKLRADFVEAHYNLGNTLLQTGRVSEAIDEYEQALRISPDDAAAHNNLGNAMLQAGRIPESIGQFEQALKFDPGNAETHYDLGGALLQAGRFAQAEEQFEQAVQSKPDYAEAHGNLGVALYLLGRIPEAIEQFKQALQIKPDYSEARANLAKAQAMAKGAPAKE